MSQETVARFLPAGARIHRVAFNGRRRVFYGGGGRWSHSKFWGRGPERACIVDCVAHVWTHHTQLAGEACWVENLQ